MGDPIIFDAAYPGPSDPHVDGCMVYIGGDTPHVWTDAEIAAAPGRYRLPVYVRSNPWAADPHGDAGQAIAWLRAHAWPKGKAILLDLETAVAPNYVSVFGQLLHAAGFLVWPYGSKSTLYQNPALDGFLPSDPTGVDHVIPGSVGTQFLFAVTYDEDDIAAVGGLEDLQAPPVAPVVPPIIKENEPMAFLVSALNDPADASKGGQVFVIDNDVTQKVYVPDTLTLNSLSARFGSPEPVSKAFVDFLPTLGGGPKD